MTDPGLLGVRVLQRVLFPIEDNIDVVPLYVETDMQFGAAGEAAASSTRPGDMHSSVRFDFSRESQRDDTARRTAVIRAGKRASFGSYFNAFAASYWRRWSGLEQVRLRIRLAGDATIIVYRSNASGTSHPVRTVQVHGNDPQAVELELPLSQFIDGGWYWFDIAAASADVVLLEADWAARTERLVPRRLSIGITTFNRPGYCLDLLRTIGAAPNLLSILDSVYVIDQGTDRIEDHPDFAAATKGVADLLNVITQHNLGGSGGFSRAMDETITAGTSEYLLLLDDDIILEPESVERAATFADLARQPIIVGGHMFSMHERAVLHAIGETVAAYEWWWGCAPNTHEAHDFGRQSLRNTPWLHRRVDVDYNGWWMCLIPTDVIRKLGLALPVFIKWDDAEYGLRAKAAGFPTVSMPGVAVWHIPWQDKNDAVDWQAYYHLRNRMITALLHSPYEHGGRLVGDSLESQVRHLLSMQYSSAALRLLALEDVLSGPRHLHAVLPIRTPELRKLRGDFPDARGSTDLAAFPTARRTKPPKRGRVAKPPTSKLGLLGKTAAGIARQAAPVPSGTHRQPQQVIAHQDAQWWVLAGIDGAVVSAADGASAAWYQRDSGQFRSLLRRSVALHARLLREWPQLRQQYRAEARAITSAEQWRTTFETVRPAARRGQM